jgi:cytochrome c peroxidase
MHDGSLATLEQVVEFYDKGGEDNPNLDLGIAPLRLTDQEKRGLIAFLNALTGSGSRR